MPNIETKTRNSNKGSEALGAFRLLLVPFLLAGSLKAVAPAAQEPVGAGEKLSESAVKQDRLLYADGDSVAGTLLSNDGVTIVFNSPRFGVLKVSCAEARVLNAEAVSQVRSKPAAPGNPSPEATGVEGAVASAPSDKGKDKEKPEGWHGRLAFSSEMVRDSERRHNALIEARVERKWTKDEFKLTGRYEFASTDDIITTEVSRLEGDWRHVLSPRFFTVYRPSMELNKHYEYEGLPADYFVWQQDIGIGWVLVDKKHVKIKPGVSALTDDVWVISQNRHFSRFVPTNFLETEITFPLGTKLTHRGMRYYPLTSSKDGWESQTEISRKFSDKLRLSLVNEIRRNDPDMRVQDYTAWRFMVGYEF